LPTPLLITPLQQIPKRLQKYSYQQKLVGEQYFKPLPYLVMGCIAIFAAIGMCFLPETKNLPLPETMEDAKQLNKYVALCFNKGLFMKDVRSQGGSLSTADNFWTRGVLQMRTSALFGAKKFRFFEIYAVSARTRGERVVPVRKFCRQGEEGQFFSILCWTSFMDGP